MVFGQKWVKILIVPSFWLKIDDVNGKYSYKDRTGRCLPKSNDITIFFYFIIMPFSSFAEIFLHLWKMDNKFWFRISMNTSSNNQLVVTWGGQNLTMFVCYPKDPVLRHCISYEHHKKASDTCLSKGSGLTNQMRANVRTGLSYVIGIFVNEATKTACWRDKNKITT